MSDEREAESEELVTLGHITAHYGLKGWLKVHSDTDPRGNITTYSQWWIRPGGDRNERGLGRGTAATGRWRKVEVREGREQGKTVVVRLAGVSDRESASAFIGSEIAVRRSDLPDARPGEYYWTDLVGLEVVTVEGVRFGIVQRLFETGANDVVVVSDEREGQTSEGARGSLGSAGSSAEILIPWVMPDVIVSVDIDAGQVTVDWDPDY